MTKIKTYDISGSCPDVLVYDKRNEQLIVGGYMLDDAKNQTKSGNVFVFQDDELVMNFDDVGAIFDLKISWMVVKKFI